MNGNPIPNPARRGAAECVDEQGRPALCCSWQPDAAAQAYIAVALVLVTWTMLLAGQVSRRPQAGRCSMRGSCAGVGHGWLT